MKNTDPNTGSSRDMTAPPPADSGSPIIDSSSATAGVAPVVRDQTGEPSVPASISASEVRYRRLFESAQDGILILDAGTGVVVDVNPFLTELLGYSFEQIQGKKIWELGFFKDILASLENFLELQRQEYLRYEDLPLKTADGRKIDVEFVSNVYLVNGERVIQCNIRDITDRKRAEDSLRREQILYKDLVNTQPTGVYRLRVRPAAEWNEDNWVGQMASHYSVDLVSDRFCEITGISRQEFESNPRIVPDRVHPDDRLDFIRKNSEAVTNLSPFSWEGRLMVSERQVIWAYLESIPRLIENGEVIWTGIVSDVTERKRAEAALLASETRYRRLFEAAKDGNLILDAETGAIVDVNPFLVEMLGFSREQFLGKKIWELGFFKDIVANQDNFAELQRREYIRYENLPLETADGRRIDVDFIGNVYQVDQRRLYQCNIRDISDRRRAEAALLASEARYRRLFEAAKDGNLILDAETGAIVDVNPFLVEMLGFSREQFLGKKIWELGFFKDIVASQDNFAELQRREYIRYENLPLETADGRRIDVDFIGNVYQVDQRRLFQCNIRDITDRKRAEDRKRLANEVLQLLNRSGSDLDTVHDLLHLIQQCTVLEAVGIRLRQGDDFPYVCYNGFPMDFVATENSLVALNPDGSFCHDESGNLSLECTCGLVVSGRTDPANPCFTRGGSCWTNPLAASPDLPALKDHRLNPRNRCLHEGYRSVALIPLRLGNEIIGLLQLNDHRPNQFTLDQIEFFEGLGASISIALSKKRAEAALRESEDKYRIITGNMSDQAWLMDMNFQTIYISPSVTRTRGFTFEELQALPLEKNFTPASMQIVSQVLAQELAPERLAQKDLKIERTLELEFSCKDGSFSWSEVTITLIRDHEGKPSGFVGVGRDISERKRAQVEREKLESQFRQSQKMEAIAMLAGGVAHDFNNQLTVILTSAGMALKDADPQGQIFEDLTDIYNAAQRSADLTRQLLSFARKELISPRVMDLNDTIGELLKMLGRLIGEGIRLIWKPSSESGLVKIDPSQLDQLLANLAVNARDAIGGHGSLTIETENVDFDESYCQIYPDCAPGPYVMLTVSDDGCGMEPETQARLFEPFFTTKEQGKGTGLGLATVYGIVRQNGGIINVYSEPGQGTTFKIYLPQAQGSAGVVTAKKGKILRGDETVLLVEDEEPILKIAMKIMKQCGYQVLSTRSPLQAVELAEQHPGPIHLLLTDEVMPEMNGKELAGKIIALRPKIKTLYMSGYTSDIIAHNGVIEEGALFLQKPFSQETLATKIREALSG